MQKIEQKHILVALNKNRNTLAKDKQRTSVSNERGKKVKEHHHSVWRSKSKATD